MPLQGKNSRKPLPTTAFNTLEHGVGCALRTIQTIQTIQTIHTKLI
jgi:hypothetical protein